MGNNQSQLLWNPLAFIGATILAALFVMVLFHDATAMQFEVRQTTVDGRTIKLIHAEGSIVPSDARDFVSIVSQNPDAERWLEINSPGGSVSAAKELAQQIRAFDFSIVVDKSCASACSSIIFPSGYYSVLKAGALLGFHSCYGQNLETLDWCNEEIADFAVQNGFPHGSVRMFMEAYGPYEMRWMSEITAKCFGYYRGYGDEKPINSRQPCIEALIAFYLFNTSKVDREREASMKPLGPSFDCSKATDDIEHLLCHNSELMLIDRTLGIAFQETLKRSSPQGRRAIARQQREWITTRNAACAPLLSGRGTSLDETREGASCIARFTRDRLTDFVDMHIAAICRQHGLERPTHYNTYAEGVAMCL